MEKTKWGGIKRVSSNSWVGGTDGRKMESTVLEQQKNVERKCPFAFPGLLSERYRACRGQIQPISEI